VCARARTRAHTHTHTHKLYTEIISNISQIHISANLKINFLIKNIKLKQNFYLLIITSFFDFIIFYERI